MKDKTDLAVLCQLAGLTAEKSAARLARIQSLIDALEGKAADLRRAAPAAPVSITEAVMRDRWHRWRTQQITLLNMQVARLQAVAQPQREVHARNTARNAVLEKLSKKR